MFKDVYILLIVLSAMLLSVFSAYGTAINVNVGGILDTTSKEIDCCSLNNGVMTASYDVFNSGSIAYSARIRLDVSDENEEITSIWSKEYKLNPGQRDTIEIYWYEPLNTVRIAKARLYRAYDILDIGNITWIFNDIYSPENFEKTSSAIRFNNIQVYDDKIKFKITADNDVGKIIVYPIRYTKGWLFEQMVVENTIANKSKSAHINYDTGAFFEDEITLIAVSSDGKYYGEKTIVLKKETGLKKWINIFIDMLD